MSDRFDRKGVVSLVEMMAAIPEIHDLTKVRLK